MGAPDAGLEQVRELPSGAHLYRAVSDGHLVDVRTAMQWLGSSPEFRSAMTETIAQYPSAAVRFEAPAVDIDGLGRSFEFLLLDSPKLVRRADPTAFDEHLASAGGDVAVFPSLRGDSVLVAPPRLGPDDDFAHLAAFLRSAPPTLSDALWQAVARAFMAQVSSGASVWLNTAGAGVPWLHFRLDARPKYYRGGWFERESP